MKLFFTIFILLIIVQRLVELVIAKRNEKWMMNKGGIEYGKRHYKLFIYLHTVFFISLIMEVLINKFQFPKLNVLLILIFIATQIVRIWCIQTLGRFWNTKIIVLPKVIVLKKGPYKYMRHPNYLIVGLELLIIPLLFGAIVTAIVFPILHIFLLMIRIPKEEKALLGKL